MAQTDDEWLALALQDSRDESVSGDSRHGMGKLTIEAEPDPMEDKMLGAV